MLETKHLSKIYYPKKGVPTKALDDVSLKFPETGMVFLVGKSGSGKSTLLNLLGGLDKYDNGEIIIKGVSSRRFRQQHFDSYRNTYVGFIFQEYNVLEEFTVGANIALALELQGKKATDEELNRILTQVDLEGYGNRKPNELSGGQKQRVAIARALVKNPKIIMADEPTGALDSVTGKQVLDTLKKLSQTKLVIVVSHDREFAAHYADRIIELADGKVISDRTLRRQTAASTEQPQQSIKFAGNTAHIPAGYHLTEEDRLAINAYIDALNAEARLDFAARDSLDTRFEATDQNAILHSDPAPFKLIRSKLPLKSAFKIGSGGLKYKKFRLAMTILLSCVAFGLFGLADTFGAYDHIKTCTNSILDSGINYAALSKAHKVGDDLVEYWRDGLPMTQEDLTKLRQDTGIPFKGVLSQLNGDYLGFNANLGDMEKLADEGFQLHINYFHGTVELAESEMNDLGFTLVAGTMPDGSKNELAISTFIYRTFTKTGYRSADANSDTVTEIKAPADLVGKTLHLNGETYTITGVVETGLDWDRYAHLAEDQEGADTADDLLNFVLYSEFTYATSCNYTGMMLVGPGKVEAMLREKPVLSSQDLYFMQFSDPDANLYLYSEYAASLGNIDASLITWLDGERTVLGPREIVVTSDILWSYAIGDEETHQTPDYTPVMDYDLDLYWDDWRSNSYFEESGYQIVGVIDVYTETCPFNSTIILPDGLYQGYAKVGEGQFSSALAAMPSTAEGVRALMEYCYDESGDMRYSVNNPVCYELDTVNELLQVFSKIFLYVGLGFCLFASILLANFIATSISYKKEEIGILRAIGSRGNDVFRIFFSESFIIAMINFAVSTIGVLIATIVVNYVLRTQAGILITVLTFGVRQVLLILLVSLAVAFIASWFPVHRIAAKRPIDAIRNR